MIHKFLTCQTARRLFVVATFWAISGLPAVPSRAIGADPTADSAKAKQLATAQTELRSPDVKVRRTAIGALVHSDLSPALFPEMRTALKDEDGKVRETAATAIGNLGSGAVAAIPQLIAQLQNDSEKEARETGARALGRIGKAAPGERGMLDPLRTAAVKDADPVTRVVALGALSMIDDDLTGRITALRTYLHHAEPLVRMKAAHALGMIGLPAKEAAPEIVKVLEQETDAHRRGYVARALGSTGDPASLPALYSALQKETYAGAQGEMRGAISRLGGKVPEATSGLPPAAEVKQAFLKQLDRPRVALDPQILKTETADGRVFEQLTIASERKGDGSVERVPLLLVRPEKATVRLPAVIVLHGTGGNKESQQAFLVELAQRGIIGVALDARYHGARSGGANGAAAYVAAITRAWKTPAGQPQEHPFYFDTCWDIWRTIDYLQTRPEVDGERLGIIGFSMGGIQTWLAAAVDDRIKVAVPAISVQSFRWSLDRGEWQGRARTIGGAHAAAAADLGEPEVNARVCRELWNKVIPGMLDQFDCPSMIRLFAGRPLLILNGELDPNCPIGGAKLAFAAAETAYREAGIPEKLVISVAPGVAHQVTPEQRHAALDWLARWLGRE